MYERHRKLMNNNESADSTAPPLLLRRRLSVPETIMRKHLLAQERSSSQESIKSRESETQSCNWPVSGGSDPNLNRRRDPDIRKSTLLKRFWESSRNNEHFPRAYAEWQYSFGRAAKMGSNSSHSSPLHEASLKLSRKLNSAVVTSDESSKDDRKTINDDEELERVVQTDSESSYVIYSSNFSKVDTSNENNNEGNLDHVNENEGENTSASNRSVAENDSTEDSKQLPNLPIQYQFIMNNESPRKESATQTNNTTNLNVITNVQLSPGTLHLIFNRVMQDVMSTETKNANEIRVQKMPSFHVGSSPNGNQLSKTQQVEAEINVGSPYKIEKSSSVPRLSALPRTTSMEVNLSSNDSLDIEISVESSPMDSLEDIKPREGRQAEGISDLVLPDNSSKDQTKRKASMFYVSMDNDVSNKSDINVALPSKLKERLHKRQLKREEKKLERMKADLQNTNLLKQYFSSSTPQSDTAPKTTTKTKTMLPRIDNKHNHSSQIPERDKSPKSFWLPKTRSNYTAKPRPQWSKSGKQKKAEKAFVHSPKIDSDSSSCSSKQIEILEIMEIVDPDRCSIHLTPKSKSKIPVLQNSCTKLPKLQSKSSKIYNVAQGDPKLDQLIANILIDTLNHPNHQEHPHRANLANNNGAERGSIFLEKAADLLTKQVLDNNNIGTPTLAEHIVDANQMNAESIPKGWITFYMLRKNQNQTPESTSDEGDKTATKSTQISDTESIKRNVKSTSFRRDESAPESDSGSPMRSKRKSCEKRERNDAGWTVTVSGSNASYVPADLEVKLKFPHLESKQQLTKNGLNYQDISNKTKASEIDKSKQYLKNIRQSEKNASIKPRDTKTSKQRYMLHQHIDQHDESSHLSTILNGFTSFLSVQGSSVHRGKPKHLLPKINEQDLKRLLFYVEEQKK